VVSIFFNAGSFLSEAVESVLGQTCRDFELLLVDDGSTDESGELARDLASRHPDRIRCLQHPGGANRGMSASRNLGIREARGEFVAFIDSDDRWRPSKLQEQVAIFDSNPGLDAVCGAVNYWRSWEGGEDRIVRTGHVQDEAVPAPEAALSVYPLGKADAPCPSDLMVRRSTALALGGFEEDFTGPLQMYEDQAFLAKLYLCGKVYFAARTWLDYRVHENSCVATVSRDGQYDDVRRHFLDWYTAYLDRSGHENAPLVGRAVERARAAYRFPALLRGVRAAKRAVRQLRR